jgi:glycosyltransferase involved in cell wall biosynthesis
MTATLLPADWLPSRTLPRPPADPAFGAPETKPLRVVWIGLRGFPNVQGGVEQHAQQLCTRLAEQGCEVTVLARAPYQPPVLDGRWQGVRLWTLWAPRHRSLEAIFHSAWAVLVAALVIRPDVLHIQAIGPALVTPLARALGLTVVVTHHGADDERQKWGPLARWALRTGERWAARHAHALIVIAPHIAHRVQARHARACPVVPNGLPALATRAAPCDAQTLRRRFGLEAGRYVLMVARWVPEKRQADLLAAFRAARLTGWKLVLVGGVDHDDDAMATLQAQAAAQPDVVLTGVQTGEMLQGLYAHAGVFVLPSSHEGQPIVVLEALSHGLPVVLSDIPAHRALGVPDAALVPLGDVEALAMALRQSASRALTPEARAERQAWVTERFDWDRSAADTRAIYEALRTVRPIRAS